MESSAEKDFIFPHHCLGGDVVGFRMWRQSTDADIYAGADAGETCSAFCCTAGTDVTSNATDTPNADTPIDSIDVDVSSYSRTSPASGSAEFRRNLPRPVHRNLRSARIGGEFDRDHFGDHQ